MVDSVGRSRGPGFLGSNELIVIKGSSGDDKISVTPNRLGGVDVRMTDPSGRSSVRHLNPDEASRLVIKGGAGNDNIYVDPRVKQGITIDGGKGNDRITGGSGND
ncbi:MAG TPA: hypothetical protein VH815_07010, partial [Acidobacteriota bacterium]